MRNLIKEPTDQKLTPYLFENGASYRSYAILAPNLTIARDHNKTSRLGGKYVGIDNRTTKQQSKSSTVGILARESSGELRVRTMINLEDYIIPEGTPEPVIRAFIAKVGKWDIDRQDSLIGNTTSVNQMIEKLQKEI